MALSISKAILVAGILMLIIRIDVSGQSTAHAIISATVTEVVGTINSSGIPPANLFIRSKAGTIESRAEQVSLLLSGKVADISSVTLIGKNFAYAITLPASAVLKRRGGNETIQAYEFNISSSALNEDRQMIYFGATFKIDAFQAAGDYSAIAPIPVTVHYN